MDARAVIHECPPSARVLVENDQIKVIVRQVPVDAAHSVICNRPLVSYFDNISVVPAASQ
eukprot:2536657-Prymnesium_polylepis.1